MNPRSAVFEKKLHYNSLSDRIMIDEYNVLNLLIFARLNQFVLIRANTIFIHMPIKTIVTFIAPIIPIFDSIGLNLLLTVYIQKINKR